MAERYTRLYSLPENLYTPGAPVVIAAGALLKDNQTGKTLAQIKFKSISEKQIKAVKISVSAFDVAGKELEGVAEYQYLDLTATRNSEFGQKQAVLLPDAVTRSFEAKCTDVVFGDGTVWNAATNAKWLPFPTQASITSQLGDFAVQYQRDTSSKSKFIPLDYEDLWLCSCGEINHNGEYICHSCRNNKEALFAALDLETLQQRNADYDQAKAEREKVEAEEAAQRAAAEQKQKAKSRKISILVAVPLLAVIAALLIITKVVIPNSKYNNALALMESGQYTQAIVAFEALDGYKDSNEQISVCEIGILDGKYNDAIALMDEGRYEEAIVAFEALKNYKDSTSQVAICRELQTEKDLLEKYNEAIALMDAGKTMEAYEAFAALGEYKDSAEKATSLKFKYQYNKIKQAKPGDMVILGMYEQDGNEANGEEPIEWLVLDVHEDKMLVISKNVLASKRFDNDYVPWKDSQIRKWLNEEFVRDAFDGIENKLIMEVDVYEDGQMTTDSIFLLGEKEVTKYFNTVEESQCEATKYATIQAEKEYLKGEKVVWTLRTTCEEEDSSVFTNDSWATDPSNYWKLVGINERFTTYLKVGEQNIRPAMWIGLSVVQ